MISTRERETADFKIRPWGLRRGSGSFSNVTGYLHPADHKQAFHPPDTLRDLKALVRRIGVQNRQ